MITLKESTGHQEKMSTASRNDGRVQDDSSLDRPKDAEISAPSGKDVYFMPTVHATRLDGTLAIHICTQIKTPLWSIVVFKKS